MDKQLTRDDFMDFLAALVEIGDAYVMFHAVVVGITVGLMMILFYEGATWLAILVKLFRSRKDSGEA